LWISVPDLSWGSLIGKRWKPGLEFSGGKTALVAVQSSQVESETTFTTLHPLCSTA
jgi:hypothetical protein